MLSSSANICARRSSPEIVSSMRICREIHSCDMWMRFACVLERVMRLVLEGVRPHFYVYTRPWPMMVERRMESTVGKWNELHFVIVIACEFICNLSSAIVWRTTATNSSIKEEDEIPPHFEMGEKNSSHAFLDRMCWTLKFVWTDCHWKISSVQNFSFFFFRLQLQFRSSAIRLSRHRKF